MEKEELEDKIRNLREELGKYNIELNRIRSEEEKNRQKSELEQLAENKSSIKFTIQIGEYYFLFVGVVKKWNKSIQFNGISVSYRNEYDEDGSNNYYEFDQLKLEYISDLEKRMENTENGSFKLIKSYSEVFSHFKHYISQINSFIKNG